MPDLYICGHQRESSSVGRARPCQGRGREFESRLSLKSLTLKRERLFFYISIGLYIHRMPPAIHST
jgi:hypothetical protein